MVFDNSHCYMDGKVKTKIIKCPFHEEQTPSCSLNFKTKLFHCYGCGKRGIFREGENEFTFYPMGDNNIKTVKLEGE